MECESLPDDGTLCSEFLNLEPDEDDSTNLKLLPDIPPNVGTRPPPSILEPLYHPQQVDSQAYTEPCQQWLRTNTIQPSQLQFEPISLHRYQGDHQTTSNRNPYQDSTSPYISCSPSITNQTRLRMRRIAPAPTKEANDSALEPSPSSHDNSTSGCISVLPGASQPTQQNYHYLNTDLACHCGKIAKTPDRLRLVVLRSLGTTLHLHVPITSSCGRSGSTEINCGLGDTSGAMT